MRSLLPILLITLLGCEDGTTTVDARCELQVESLDDTWQRGNSNTVLATPLTDQVDTLVMLNNINLMVNDIDTSSCAECNTCKTNAGCTECGFCTTCTVECADCQHELQVDFPLDFPVSEEYWLTVHNSLGSSYPVLITVLEE